MKRNTKIALALVGGLAVATVAYAHGGQGSWGGGGWGGYGPGAMMGGYGPGAMMGGYGRGGMMGGYGYGPGGMTGGYGPGAMMGGYGYGPGAMMGGYGYGPGAMMGGYGPRGPRWGAQRGAGPFSDLDGLAERLNLTDAQKPLLEDLRTAVNAAREQRRADFRHNCFDGDDDDGGAAATANSPVERMNSRVTRMEQRVASMKAIDGAFAKLYASLTPEQQAQADQLFARGRGFGNRGNHHRWMHGDDS